MPYLFPYSSSILNKEQKTLLQVNSPNVYTYLTFLVDKIGKNMK